MSEDTKRDTLFENAKKRFRLVASAESRQREREREDLRFQVPELQWDADARAARMGTQGDPPRPMLSVSKLDQPIRAVTNQERNAHLGISIHPQSPDADDKTAEVMQGLYRAIERRSRAAHARSWGFDRSVKAGRGWELVETKYVDDPNAKGAEVMDQEICITRILYQDCVYMDPAATRMDCRDARFAFLVAWVPVEDFKKMFPAATVSTSEEFSWNDYDPDWVRDEADGKAVLVASYWYKETEYEDVKYTDGDRKEHTRKRESTKLYFCKISGDEIVEGPSECNGTLIPLVPFIGRELQPFDGERRFEGIIRPNRDAQKIFNYTISNGVEIVALEPKAPWILDPKQIEGYEDFWAQSNTRSFPYLPHNNILIGGSLAPPPQRSQIDASRLGATMTLYSLMNESLQSGTMQYDPSLGRATGNEKSGKAIMALQAQGNEATSDFLGNDSDISLPYEAEVVIELMPYIYDRPGRVARILDEHDQSKPVMLNAAFKVDERTGQVVAVPDADPSNLPPGVDYFDLRKGSYAVTVSVGKSKQSRMEMVAEELGAILQARPELMPLIGPEYFRHRDFPGAHDIADNLLKLRNQQYPFLEENAEGGPSPEQLQAQVQQMGQQMQALQQQLQQMNQVIETDHVKAQATLQGKAMDIASKERIAGLEMETKKVIAAMESKQEEILALLKARSDDQQADKDVGREVTKKAAEAALMPKPYAGSVGRDLAAPTGEV